MNAATVVMLVMIWPLVCAGTALGIFWCVGNIAKALTPTDS